jgi:GntR family transcriptional regulator
MTRHYTRLNSIYEEAQEQGLKPSSTTLKMVTMPAEPSVAEKLALKKDAMIHYIERLRLLNDDPIALHVVRLPFELFPDLKEEHLAGSLYRYYQDQGNPIIWGTQRIEARTATREQSQILKLPKNSPLLYSARITYSKNDIPIEFVEAYAGGAPYAIEITLFREG